MALVGYARVSSRDQNLDVQRAKLAHCEKLFTDTYTGSTQARPGLQACLEWIREGDTLHVTRLDRLARSTLDLCTIAQTLQRKGVGLEVIEQAVETKSPTGRLLFHILAIIAEFERELSKERQMEGIAAAQARGVHFGRKHALTPAQVIEVQHRRAQGVLIKTLMQDYHLSKAALYRYLAQAQPAAVEAAD